MPDDKLHNFLRACGAARLLLARAHDEQFLIEGVVLYASLIDAFLRIALVLKKQLIDKTSEIDESYISQDGADYYSERQIYKFALENKIISEKLHQILGELYDKRNNIIHKFFLTNIEYKDLPEVCISYEMVYKQLYEIVYNLEEEQIVKGIGMTIRGEKITKDENTEVLKDIGLKIDSKTQWDSKMSSSIKTGQ